MPAVSIILPLYNGQPFIRHTISKIRSQTFQDWELLVVNDGSSDGGEAVAMREAQQDHRIRVFRKPNSGISSARNYGITRAAGTYIAFADQDDTPFKNWLEDLYRGMAPDVDLTVGGKKLTVIDVSGKVVKSRICRYEDTVLETEQELYGFLFHQEHDASAQHVWNCMYKKELIDKHGIRFDEQLAMGMEDVLFNICYGYYCRKIRKIPQIVYSYQQRAGISTSTKYNPDLVKEYAHRMQRIARLSTDGFRTQSNGYRMYGDYALRELCNLYFRSRGADSFELLAGLRDAYVQNVPEKVAVNFQRQTAEKVKTIVRKMLYAAADDLLRKKRYTPLILLKNGADLCRKRGKTDGSQKPDQQKKYFSHRRCHAGPVLLRKCQADLTGSACSGASERKRKMRSGRRS